jgi:L-arabinose transport system ATP-binding protein
MTAEAGARPGAPRSVLRLDGVGKRFPNVVALAEVELELSTDETLALVGENGAGKSTLLRILSGDYEPDSGRLILDGRPIELGGPAAAQQLGLRVIYQEPEVVPWVSVAENLFIGRLPRRGGRFNRSGLERRARDLIRERGFDDVLDARMMGADLSSSQRQLVEILRALEGEARLIAFDEPTSSLTETEAERLFAIVGQLRDQGIGVIYVSHRLREVLALADRIAVLRDGQLVATRAAGETSEAELMRLMVGRPVSTIFRDQHQVRERVALRAEGVWTDHVRDIALEVRAGEVLGLAGLVGSGRSEVARALAGVDPLRAGRVTVDGEEVTLRSPRSAIAAGIAYAPEDRKGEALVMQRSVGENISLALLPRISRMNVVRRGVERRTASELAQRLSIKTPSLDQDVSKLSGGNQQKVVLARWLAMRPRVLILDEPTRGIDVGAKAQIYALIDELAAEGLGVIFISSEMLEVLGVSDRLLVMKDGAIAGELSREEATEERVIELAMADDDIVATTDGGA